MAVDPGHVFVVRGDATKLACDAQVVDFADDELLSADSAYFLEGEVHVACIPSKHARSPRFVVELAPFTGIDDVWADMDEGGGPEQSMATRASAWLHNAIKNIAETVRESIIEVVRQYLVEGNRKPRHGRQRHLVAMPVIRGCLVNQGAPVSTGNGTSHTVSEMAKLRAVFRNMLSEDAIMGPLAGELLAAAQRAAGESGVDVVIAAENKAQFFALQMRRTSELATCDLARHHLGSNERGGRGAEPAGWARISADGKAEATRLASFAAAGRLAVFVGAGISASAGLPMWRQLLEKLAARAMLFGTQSRRASRSHDAAAAPAAASACAASPMSEQDRARHDFRGMDLMDQAMLVQHELEKHGLHLGEEVAKLLQSSEYALGHALVTSLGVREAVTTNYDTLLESAIESSNESVSVMPNRPVHDAQRWLLKMHGCVSEPKGIVLTRADYARYAEESGALRGIVQASLMTSHMLLLGFGLQDPNFFSLFTDVERAVRRGEAAGQPRRLGTVVMLQHNTMQTKLWERRLRFVCMETMIEEGATPTAGRGIPPGLGGLGSRMASMRESPKHATRAGMGRRALDRKLSEYGGLPNALSHVARGSVNEAGPIKPFASRAPAARLAAPYAGSDAGTEFSTAYIVRHESSLMKPFRAASAEVAAAGPEVLTEQDEPEDEAGMTFGDTAGGTHSSADADVTSTGGLSAGAPSEPGSTARHDDDEFQALPASAAQHLPTEGPGFDSRDEGGAPLMSVGSAVGGSSSNSPKRHLSMWPTPKPCPPPRQARGSLPGHGKKQPEIPALPSRRVRPPPPPPPPRRRPVSPQPPSRRRQQRKRRATHVPRTGGAPLIPEPGVTTSAGPRPHASVADLCRQHDLFLDFLLFATFKQKPMRFSPEPAHILSDRAQELNQDDFELRTHVESFLQGLPADCRTSPAFAPLAQAIETLGGKHLLQRPPAPRSKRRAPGAPQSAAVSARALTTALQAVRDFSEGPSDGAAPGQDALGPLSSGSSGVEVPGSELSSARSSGRQASGAGSNASWSKVSPVPRPAPQMLGARHSSMGVMRTPSGARSPMTPRSAEHARSAGRSQLSSSASSSPAGEMGAADDDAEDMARFASRFVVSATASRAASPPALGSMGAMRSFTDGPRTGLRRLTPVVRAISAVAALSVSRRSGAPVIEVGDSLPKVIEEGGWAAGGDDDTPGPEDSDEEDFGALEPCGIAGGRPAPDGAKASLADPHSGHMSEVELARARKLAMSRSRTSFFFSRMGKSRRRGLLDMQAELMDDDEEEEDIDAE